jgi:hypothetical protein
MKEVGRFVNVDLYVGVEMWAENAKRNYKSRKTTGRKKRRNSDYKCNDLLPPKTNPTIPVEQCPCILLFLTLVLWDEPPLPSPSEFPPSGFFPVKDSWILDGGAECLLRFHLCPKGARLSHWRR